MIMGNLINALVSMGYRKLNPNKQFWMKPIGYSTIIINIENNLVTMELLFLCNEEIEVWARYKFDIDEMDIDDMLGELKYGECKLMKRFHPETSSINSKFEFLTKLDQANIFSDIIN